MDFLKTALDKIRAKGAGPLFVPIEKAARTDRYYDGNPMPRAGGIFPGAFETGHEAEIWREGYAAGQKAERIIARAGVGVAPPRDASGSPIVAAEKVETPIEVSTIEDLGVRRWISPDTDLDPDLGCEPFPGSCGDPDSGPRSIAASRERTQLDQLRAENAELRDEIVELQGEIARARADGLTLGRQQGHAAAVEMELAPGVNPAALKRIALVAEMAGEVSVEAARMLQTRDSLTSDFGRALRDDLDRRIDALTAAAAIMRQEGDLPSVDIGRRAELVADLRDELDLPKLTDAEDLA
ncbi:hypothetical protein [Roseovarius sp. C03]|uniref:hypothetical protein n=1 Tax=Roseovarius sp. C03 TaxID=3449222 RepID=UPI003EDBD6CB